MEEQMLKTTWKQRIIILVIAAILLISSIAVYVAIVLGGGMSGSSSNLDKLTTEYNEKIAELADYLSPRYLEHLASYKSEITAFNSDAANALTATQVRDIAEGNGAEITEDFTQYHAYYIGYCANGTVFDSSFDDPDEPSSLKAPLDVAYTSLIEGWNTGMVGAKVGGIRELTIPAPLAYGEQENPVCGANAPLRFIVLTFDVNSDEGAAKIYKEAMDIYERYVTAYYEEYAKSQAASADGDSTNEETVDTTESTEVSD